MLLLLKKLCWPHSEEKQERHGLLCVPLICLLVLRIAPVRMPSNPTWTRTNLLSRTAAFHFVVSLGSLSLSLSFSVSLSLSPSLSLHVKSVKTLNIAVAPIIRVSFSRKEKHDTKEPHKCAGCILGTLLLVVCIANMFGLSPCYQVPRLLSLSSQPGQGRLPHTVRHICLWHRSFGVICQLDNQLDEVLCRQYSKRLTVPSMFAHVVAEA